MPRSEQAPWRQSRRHYRSISACRGRRSMGKLELQACGAGSRASPACMRLSLCNVDSHVCPRICACIQTHVTTHVWLQVLCCGSDACDGRNQHKIRKTRTKWRCRTATAACSSARRGGGDRARRGVGERSGGNDGAGHIRRAQNPRCHEGWLTSGHAVFERMSTCMNAVSMCARMLVYVCVNACMHARIYVCLFVCRSVCMHAGGGGPR